MAALQESEVDCMFLHFKGITMCYVLNLTFFKEAAEHDIISRQLQHAREFFMLKV